jgi:hypothetical protein
MNKQLTIKPAFRPKQIVLHVADPAARGVITGFMMRGLNHSYEVQWGIEKCLWHLDFELELAPDQSRAIGYWPQA